MADFWAGYLSGIAGIIIGSPLDIIKIRSQSRVSSGAGAWYDKPSSLIRGTAAPILGYGALNALLFYTYNRSLLALGDGDGGGISSTDLWKVWIGGAIGGLATFVVSTPQEVVKCRAQVSNNGASWTIAKELYSTYGIKGLYLGGVVTSLRDSIGYGFYFWAYEGSKRFFPTDRSTTTPTSWTPEINTLLCGGIAGLTTWASIYPLDVVKTQVQVQPLAALRPAAGETRALLTTTADDASRRNTAGAWKCAKTAYAEGGASVFWNGIGVCLGRAFIVNAVTFFTYEWALKKLGDLGFVFSS